jgi:uncharacterized coiled-coil DUF342 family protein
MPDKEHQGDPGSWQREWDRTHTSPEDLRKEIRELRERIRSYLKDIDDRDQMIANLREELALQEKYWLKSMNFGRHE